MPGSDIADYKPEDGYVDPLGSYLKPRGSQVKNFKILLIPAIAAIILTVLPGLITAVSEFYFIFSLLYFYLYLIILYPVFLCPFVDYLRPTAIFTIIWLMSLFGSAMGAPVWMLGFVFPLIINNLWLGSRLIAEAPARKTMRVKANKKAGSILNKNAPRKKSIIVHFIILLTITFLCLYFSEKTTDMFGNPSFLSCLIITYLIFIVFLSATYSIIGFYAMFFSILGLMVASLFQEQLIRVIALLFFFLPSIWEDSRFFLEITTNKAQRGKMITDAIVKMAFIIIPIFFIFVVSRLMMVT